jgi:hypothetical protein
VPNSKSTDAIFPAEKLKAILDGYWQSKMLSPLKPPMTLPVAGTVLALQPELSSQQAVAVLVSCKAVLGYRPSKNVIQKGGYVNKADFINGLLGEMSKEFATKQEINFVSTKVKGETQNAAATV